MAHRTPSALKVADAVLYALAVTAVVGLLGALVGVVRGSLLTSAVYVLFWLGFVTMGLGTWKLRPEAPYADESRLSMDDSRRDTPFQRAVRSLPPLRGADLPPEDRFSDGAKLLLASATMLGTSFLLGYVLPVVVQ